MDGKTLENDRRGGEISLETVGELSQKSKIQI